MHGHALLPGALAKLPGPGSELRRPILVAWDQDHCLGGVLPGRAPSKQTLRVPGFAARLLRARPGSILTTHYYMHDICYTWRSDTTTAACSVVVSFFF